ncbi:DUF732 domain-containing protein [Mycolicibacter sinensis]|uniref:DUF732 domain-containing protein n=1 Tax=Mycolicibacter sinensis (strain JDM601) TaxID=875328 RepID=A0A1A3TL09_MYCSD|nr:DUF732 domain-containing protein [Mycolicibacter sinensis]OBK83375.1 hypothetical protein A5648_00360 [Mycolicibacter sinensis]
MAHLAWVTAASLGLLVGSAGVAQADDQAFLEQIPPRNYFSMWSTDASRLAGGYQICTSIKTGTPPNVTAESYRFDDGWAWVNAAQRELCPDTLQGQPAAPTSSNAG